MDTVDSAITKPVRRLEVFTGAGRRRTWSDEDKARVVAEIETSGDSVSGVARRHGLSPQQLFGWRRQVRESQTVASRDDEPRFVPAVVDAALSDTAGPRQRKTRRRDRDEPLAGTIEVAIDGVMVRIGPGAPAGTIAAVLRALKAGA
jgi:transposase